VLIVAGGTNVLCEIEIWFMWLDNLAEKAARVQFALTTLGCACHVRMQSQEH
jgi:hypothetical protein